MGLFRFLYANLITGETMITLSSLAAGQATLPLKGSNAVSGPYGVADLEITGDYSGAYTKEYAVEIDSVFSGNEIGQATFRWSDDGGSTWDESGVTTSGSFYTLNNNIQVKFIGKSGNDFELLDKWNFFGFNHFKAGRMIDLDRDTRCRSSALQSPNTITIDLGSASSVSAFILMDHNLTASAAITLKGNDEDANWGTPDFSDSVSHNSEQILHYLSAAQSSRYWRLEISDAGNPDGYIEIGNLFLGSYLELSKNVAMDQTRELKIFSSINRTSFGLARQKFHNIGKQWVYRYLMLAAADQDSLTGMLDSLSSKATQKIIPVFFNPEPDSPNEFFLARLEGLPMDISFNGLADIELRLNEVLKSV